jgi:hypothetical protein
MGVIEERIGARLSELSRANSNRAPPIRE